MRFKIRHHNINRHWLNNILLLIWLFGMVLVPVEPQQVALAAPLIDRFSCSSVTEIPQVECEALVTFYNSTGGTQWVQDTDWLITTTPGNWWGVTVEGGNVTGLYSQNNYLNGSIPAELGNLRALSFLDLSRNNLSGNIPAELGDLRALSSLYLGDNNLNGNIPAELGDLRALRSLQLQSNNLSGNIPAELGKMSALSFLDLSRNNISGGIPAELGDLSALQIFVLERNNLSGNIPVELGNLSELSILDLSRNNLSGNIPVELGDLRALGCLDLSGNKLSGNIPVELGNLSLLTYLRLDLNQLSGSIPVVLGNLRELQDLDLMYNNLSGNIPVELGNLRELMYLGLRSNQLSGNIPDELGNLHKLRNLNLDQNHLSGDVPTTFTQLIWLYNSNPMDGYAGLYLEYNHLNTPASTPELAAFLVQKDLDWASTQTIPNPVPVFTSISPRSAETDIFPLTLSITGSGFYSGSVVRWNNTRLDTTYVSASKLTAIVPTSNLAAPGTASITIFNAPPHGGTSTANVFTINGSTPTVDLLDPASICTSTLPPTITVTGSGFVRGSIVRWNTIDLVTTFINATTLTAEVPAASMEVPHAVNIKVVNPYPGGGISNKRSLHFRPQCPR